MQLLRRGISIAFTLALVACESAAGPELTQLGPRVERPGVQAYVTPAVATTLDARGRFQYLGDHGPDMITRAEAVERTETFLRVFVKPDDQAPFPIPGAVGIREVLESQHGMPIDWDGLGVDATGVFLADAYIAGLPEALEAPHARNHVGPTYLLPLIDRGVQVAHFAVAAFGTETYFTPEGYLVRPDSGGNDFSWAGLFYGRDFNVPLTPESAVVRVAEEFGVRAAAVPRLLRASILWTPFAARWEVSLEHPVDVVRVADRQSVRTDRLYVGAFPSLFESVPDPGPIGVRFFVPMDEQPTQERIPQTGEFVYLPVQEGVPVRFHEVEPAG